MPDNSVQIRVTGKYQDEVTAGVNRSIVGLKSAYDLVLSVGGKAIGLAKEFAQSVVEMGRNIYEFVAGVAETGHGLEEMSLRLGMSTAFLSELSHVANLAGVDIGGLEMSLRIMTRAAYDAATGSEAAQKIFSALRMTVVDNNGALKSAEQLFWEATAGMSALRNASEQTAIAQELFGRGGTQLLPIIKQGTDAIHAQMVEAQRLGVAYSTDAVEKSDEFIRSQKELEASIRGVKNMIAMELMPAIGDMMDQGAKWISEHHNLIQAFIQDIILAGRYLVILGDIGAVMWQSLNAIVGDLLTVVYGKLATLASIAQSIASLTGSPFAGVIGGISTMYTGAAQQTAAERDIAEKKMVENVIALNNALERLNQPIEMAAANVDRMDSGLVAMNSSATRADASLDALAAQSNAAEDELYGALTEATPAVQNFSVSLVEGSSAIAEAAAVIMGSARGLEGITATYSTGLPGSALSYPGHIMYPPVRPRPFQEGGIVTRPTVALVGEAGPEAITPLGRGGIQVIMNFNGFADRTTLERTVRDLGPEIERQVLAGLIKISAK